MIVSDLGATVELRDDASSDPDLAHKAFELALVTDEPLVFFRKRGWGRWEATLWQAERVETTAATYTYARLHAIALGGSRWSARRALLSKR